MKLVDPPMAALIMMAFSNACRVRTLERRRSSLTISTMRLPTRWAVRLRRESTAGMAAAPERVRPSDSTIHAIVDAVPMVMQCPSLREIEPSASRYSAADMLPARISSVNL